ncbi:MAG: porin [Myxococcota bacterium]
MGPETAILPVMRQLGWCTVALLVVACAGLSPVRAQEPAEDQAETETAPESETQQEAEPEPSRKRGLRREGLPDNEQVGGEPSLSEGSAGENDDTAAEGAEDEPCDLDCIEEELRRAEEKEQQKKGVLQVAEETGSLTSAVEEDDGGTLAAEPSTTSLAEVAAIEDEDRRLPTRLGPVRLPIGETEDWIGFGFASQLEFDFQKQLESPGFAESSSETLQFRRIRLTLSSKFIDGRIRSRFQINATPSAFELIDLWLAFTRFKFASLRIGQFKIPFDRYRAQSFAVLSFVDWAPTTRVFGSERQIGFEALARGGFFDLEYALGLFTGVNARASHGIGAIEFYGEVPANPSELGDGQIVREFHPELAGRVAKNFGDINTDTNSDVLGTKDLRQSVGFGFAYDARSDPIEDLTLRFSLEWLAKISGFDFNVVTYLAWFPPFEGGRIDFGPFGLMGEVGYRFDLLWELAVRYSFTYVTPKLRADARAYGEFQIENAEDPIAAFLQYGRNGEQKTNGELAIAGTAHIIGNSLKTVLQFTWENQRWVEAARNGLRVEIQLQFLF